MKNLLTLSTLLVATMFFIGCGASWSNVAYSDDLYEIHDKIKIANEQKAKAELEKAEAEAMQAQYEALLARARAAAAEKGVVVTDPAEVNGYDAILADDYNSAYARRLYGFTSPTYRMPSSYYTYRYSDAFFYASAYDPAFYNVMVSGDMVWVEPKYVTAMFGLWGATVVPSYSWYYGWGNPYWGYNWSWDWRWRSPYSWNSYWYSGLYNPYYHWRYPHRHHHHSPHPPHFGGSVGNAGHRPAQPGQPTFRNPKADTPSTREGSVYRGGSSRDNPSSGSSYRTGGSSSGSNSSYRPGSSSSSSRGSSYNSGGSSPYRSSAGSSSSSYRSSGSGNSRGR